MKDRVVHVQEWRSNKTRQVPVTLVRALSGEVPRALEEVNRGLLRYVMPPRGMGQQQEQSVPKAWEKCLEEEKPVQQHQTKTYPFARKRHRRSSPEESVKNPDWCSQLEGAIDV